VFARNGKAVLGTATEKSPSSTIRKIGFEPENWIKMAHHSVMTDYREHGNETSGSLTP
jgi:hypothetical protein